VILRLVTYNIRYGGVGREAPITAAIRACDPDLVVLQEAARPDVVDRVARASGMCVWAARRGSSLGFMSRVPVAEHAWHQPAGSRHAFLEIVLGDRVCRVFGVHLSAVHAAWTERRRVRELRALLGAIKHHQHGFHVIAGDFNTLAPGELLEVRKLPFRLRPFVWLSGGAIRWRTIQEVLDAGYADAFRLLHPTAPGLTFPTSNPHVRLDYTFIPASHTSRVKSCEAVLSDPAAAASDHFPLLAEIETEPLD
jgi:endonuclease/exonuclease/phosphatase family metal-dependent hydrolase